MASPTLHTIPDEQLLELLQKDDRAAFNTLYFRHWESLYRAAYRVLRDEAGAKDIVQEVFFSIWKKRHTQQIRMLSAYLFQAVKFQVARHLRQGKLLDIHAEQFVNIPSLSSTEEVIDGKELDDLIQKTLRHLPVRCRDIFYLSRFEHLTNQEIAERLNLSQRTVEWHISNALKHLRHAMEDSVVLMLLFLIHP